MGKETSFDKIRVLLIDDEPDTLGSIPLDAGSHVWFPLLRAPDPPAEALGIPENFELRWLAAPTEAREYWELATSIGGKWPARLSSEGYLPEIICFDYALTGDITPVEARDQVPENSVAQVSPLPILRSLAATLGVALPRGEPLPDELDLKRNDCFGLYVGGLLYATLADHPCGAVALTRYAEQTIGASKDGQFFEWFLKTRHAGTFSRRGRPAPSWYELLCDGVRSLRARIGELYRTGIIQITLDDLGAFAMDPGHPVLTVHSRYGARRFPANGLFVDFLPQQRPSEASRWAMGLIEKKFREYGSPDEKTNVPRQFQTIREGMAAAESLWQAYLDRDNDDRLTQKRLRLSELLAKGASVEDTPELADLVQLFHADIAANGCPPEDDWVRDLRLFNKDIQRWVVLFAVVRFLQHCTIGREKWRQKCRDAKWGGAAHLFDIPVHPREIYLPLFPRAYQPLAIPWGDLTAQSWARHLDRYVIRPQDILNGSEEPTQLEKMLLRDYAVGIGFSRSDWDADEYASVILG